MNDGVGRVPKNLFGLYLHMRPYRDVKLILHYQPYAAYFNLEWTRPVKRFLTAHLIPEILILGKKAVQFQQYITVFLNNKEMKEICGANIKDITALLLLLREIPIREFISHFQNEDKEHAVRVTPSFT